MVMSPPSGTSLSFCLSLSLSVSLSLAHCQSLSLSLSLCASLYLSVSLSSLAVSLYLSISLSLSPPLSLVLSLLSICLSLSLSLSHVIISRQPILYYLKPNLMLDKSLNVVWEFNVCSCSYVLLRYAPVDRFQLNFTMNVILIYFSIQ